jgi:hypothetical protein
MSSILEDEPQPIAGVRADLPPALIANRPALLAKRPDGRYASTRDLVHDLRDVIEQIVADTRSNPDGRALPPRRSIWRLGASVLVSVLAARRTDVAKPIGIVHATRARAELAALHRGAAVYQRDEGRGGPGVRRWPGRNPDQQPDRARALPAHATGGAASEVRRVASSV